MNSNWLLFLALFLSVFLLVAMIYLGYELTETRRQNQVIVQQLLQVQQQVVGTEEVQKIYIKGPVKNTIVKHSQSIQRCYLSLIESTTDIPESGKVLVDWQIDPRGKVFEAGVVRDEFSNMEFQSCLGKKISNIVFPAPPSGRSIYVEHTFVFRKEENN